MHAVDTLIAKYFILLSILITVIVWYRLDNPRRKQFIIFAVIGAVASLLLAKIGSHLHSDPRPFVTGHFTPYFAHGADNGFPSDHTLFASFMAFTVWRYCRTTGIWLFGLAVIIGLSRVIAGIHHLQDIAGAIIFAALGTWAAWWLTRRYFPDSRPRARRRPVRPGDDPAPPTDK